MLRVRFIRLSADQDRSACTWRRLFYEPSSPWVREVPADVYVIASTLLHPNMPHVFATAKPKYRCISTCNTHAKLTLYVFIAPTVVLLPQPRNYANESPIGPALCRTDQTPAQKSQDKEKTFYVDSDVEAFQTIVEYDAVCVAFTVAPNVRFIVVHDACVDSRRAALLGSLDGTAVLQTVLILSSADTEHITCGALSRVHLYHPLHRDHGEVWVAVK